MRRTGRITTIFALAGGCSLLLASLVLAGALQSDDKAWIKRKLPNTLRLVPLPIWGITQDGTAISVKWQDHTPNPRFAIYDPGTPGNNSDDLVLDKETGLVWERSPVTSTFNWYGAIDDCYFRHLGGRKGWRLPTIEELASLVDPLQGPPTLPSGHPFIDVQSSFYWSSTTNAEITSDAWGLDFSIGQVSHPDKGLNHYMWCVRGGQGHDGY